MITSPPAIATLAALALLLAACAGEPNGSAGPGELRDFAAIDADDDDVIEPGEFAEAFDRFDLNDDGVIDAAESVALVYEADTDRDGVVTPAEFRRIDLSRLEADTNLDGRLSRQELERFTREREQRIGPDSAVRGAPAQLDRENRWLQFRF